MDLLKLPYESPIKLEWKMKKLDLEALNSATKSGLFSEHYSASKIAGVNYSFKFLPYGDDGYPFSNEKTWIYLHLFAGNVKEIKAKYIISINSANVFKTIELVFKESQGRGISLCKSEEFFDPANNYFVNDEIIININGTLKFDRPLVSKTSYPFFAKWTINVAEIEQMQTENGEVFESESFDVPSNSDIKYYIRIYSNGSSDADRDETYIAFYMAIENDMKVEATVTFNINSGFYIKTAYQLVEIGHEYGFVLCSTDDFFDATKGYIVNGETTITLEGHLFVEKKDPKFKLQADDIVSLTSKFEEKNFKIIVGENEIGVNKDLLADVSTAFAGMLQSGMKETIEEKMEITDFPFKVVDAAVKLIYGISPTFTLEDMLPLLVFSDKYDIQLIKELVEEHLISELLPSNVCQLIHFSNIFNAPKLHAKSTAYFIKCYKDGVAVNDLDLLDKDKLFAIFSSVIPALPY